MHKLFPPSLAAYLCPLAALLDSGFFFAHFESLIAFILISKTIRDKVNEQTESSEDGNEKL